jgi:hypothetical protein
MRLFHTFITKRQREIVKTHLIKYNRPPLNNDYEYFTRNLYFLFGKSINYDKAKLAMQIMYMSNKPNSIDLFKRIFNEIPLEESYDFIMSKHLIHNVDTWTAILNSSVRKPENRHLDVTNINKYFIEDLKMSPSVDVLNATVRHLLNDSGVIPFDHLDYLENHGAFPDGSTLDVILVHYFQTPDIYAIRRFMYDYNVSPTINGQNMLKKLNIFLIRS